MKRVTKTFKKIEVQPFDKNNNHFVKVTLYNIWHYEQGQIICAELDDTKDMASANIIIQNAIYFIFDNEEINRTWKKKYRLKITNKYDGKYHYQFEEDIDLTLQNTKYDLLQKYVSILDNKITWEDSDGRNHSTTYRKVINAIPNKAIEYVDSILIDDCGIWIYLKEEYDFDDCGCYGGTCHVDTLKQIKEQFNYGVIVRQ